MPDMRPVDRSDRIKSRREELNLTQEQAVAAAGSGISTAVWTILESTRYHSFKRRSIVAAARALQWRDDWLDRLEAGEDPVPVTGARTIPASTVKRLDDLEARFARLERQVRQIAELTLGPDADDEPMPGETRAAE